MGLLHRAVVASLPLLPRPLMRSLSSRYIAGETLEQAMVRMQPLAANGFLGILDILGEDVANEAGAHAVVAAYVRAAEAVKAAGLDVYISVKPTHVGLRVSEDLAFELYRELAQRCAELGLFLRVEMEDHTTTDATLRVFERLRQAVDGGIGIVLQSRLFRTPKDIDALAPGPISVRMVKGIYLEQAEIAHVDPDPIRAAYIECSRRLFERGASISFATHDEGLAESLLALCRELALPKERYEFQVLLGVQERLWQKWRDDGHPVRVYVPFGPEWRAYSTRRLRKNPQILRHVMRDFFAIGR